MRSARVRLWHVPLRVVTGAFIVNSGLQKRTAGRERAEALQHLASGAYPELAQVEPMRFTHNLSRVELALGGALLCPVVPTAVVGAALTAFSVSLLGLYWRTPELHEAGSPRPTDQGVPFAKDSWMLAIGIALLVDGVDTRDRP